MSMNQSTLKVASCSVTTLFSNTPITSDDGEISGQLTIPEYQRPYTWRSKELRKLLNDLLDYFNIISNKKTNSGTIHNYYLGSIILHQESNDDKTKRLNIIDGQQRITTLAILAHWLKHQSQPNIIYNSPSSQQQILENFDDLNKCLNELNKQHELNLKDLINFDNINVTLVVTDSEDDAYRFFETQNTGGIRLNGADIIKAHHLRAIQINNQDNYARQWEALGEIAPVLNSIMKVRYWNQYRKYEKLPSHRYPILVKDEIVKELADDCNNQSIDNIAYRNIQYIKQDSGWLINTPESGFAMRQPLNSGINTIDYLTYFSNLKQTLLIKNSKVPNQEAFNNFYSDDIIQDTEGTVFLKDLFDSTLLLYISQFGTNQLFEAALWLFRIVYSIRVINQQSVRESSIPSFVEKHHLFDMIMMSFNHQQLINLLKRYTYPFDSSNTEDRNTKGRYINRVVTYFSLESLDRAEIIETFDNVLKKAILEYSDNKKQDNN